MHAISCVKEQPEQYPAWISWSCSAASVGVSAATGFAVSGPIGGLGYAAASIADEYLSKDAQSCNHRITSSIFWGDFIIRPLTRMSLNYARISFLPIQVITNVIGGIGLSYLLEDPFTFKDRLQVPLTSLRQVTQLFDSDSNEKTSESSTQVAKLMQQAKKVSESPFLRSLFCRMGLGVLMVGVNYLFLTALSNYNLQTIIFSLPQNPAFEKAMSDLGKLFEGKTADIYEKFSPELKEISLIVSKVILGAIAHNQIRWLIRKKRNEISRQQEREVALKGTELLTTNRNAFRILTHDEGRGLVTNLTKDFETLVKKGVDRLDSLLQKVVIWPFALQALNMYTPGIMLPFAIVLSSFQKTFSKMLTKIHQSAHELGESQAKLKRIEADLFENINVIELREGSEFLKHQLTSIQNKEKEIKAKLQVTQNQWKQSKTANELLFSLMSLASVGICVASEWLKLEKLNLIFHSVSKFKDYLISNLDLQNSTFELDVAQRRINRFYELLQQPEKNQAIRNYTDKPEIKVRDYILKLKTNNSDQPKTLLKIDELNFEEGTCYAIMGPSGSGKTSFLKDIKGALTGNTYSEGSLLLPRSIMFIDQDLYLPLDSTLFEGICFPKSASEIEELEKQILKKKILTLFSELKISPQSQENTKGSILYEKLDSKDFLLSGGQKKKIGLIQAILQKPDVLILDEIFVGMDRESIEKAQKTIKKYLPKTLILSVDHQANNNNFDFYQETLDFAKF